MEIELFSIQIQQNKKWKNHPDYKPFASFEEAKKEAVKLCKGGLRYATNIRIEPTVKEL